MATRTSTHLSRKNLFIIYSLLGTSIMLLVRQEVFTGDTVAESILFSSAILCLSLKYYSSSVILKYQESRYAPSKARKIWEYIAVHASTQILMPVAYSLILACVCLLTLKYIPVFDLKWIGRLILSVSNLNRQYVKTPLLIAGIVVALATLCELISDSFYKKYKSTIKKVTSPLKVVTVLLLFLSVDKGIEGKTIQFALHETAITKLTPGQQITLNSAPQSEELAQQALNALVDAVSKDIDEESEESTGATSTSQTTTLVDSISFPYDAQIEAPRTVIDPYVGDAATAADRGGSGDDVVREMKQVVTVRTKNPEYGQNFSFSSGSYPYTETEKQTVEDIFHDATTFERVEPVFMSSNLSETIHEASPNFYQNLVAVLNDENKTIHKTESSTTKTILTEYLKEEIGRTHIFQQAEDHVHFAGYFNTSLFKNAVVDDVKDLIVKAFFYLVSHPAMSRENIIAVVSSTRQAIKTSFQTGLKIVRGRIKLVRQYFADLQDKFIQDKAALFANTHPTVDVTYEQGLEVQKKYLEERESELDADEIKGECRKLLKQRYPDLEGTELERQVELNSDHYFAEIKKQIDNADLVIKDKKYVDFDFIKNFRTSGGIFFGEGLTRDGGVFLNQRSRYYPDQTASDPSAVLAPQSLWIKRSGQQFLLFVRCPNGVFQLDHPVDTALFETAYRFVFAPDRYPSIIDVYNEMRNGHYTGRQIPAYNKCFVHNAAIKDIFHTSDQFIFDALEGKIHSKELDNLLHDARTQYLVLRPTFTQHTYSRMYDESHLLIKEPGNMFSIGSYIQFSLVQELPEENSTTSTIYEEYPTLSTPFNEHKVAIVRGYDYLQKIHEFAGYQALLRSLGKLNVDILEIFSN